jgi:hypothetical protein
MAEGRIVEAVGTATSSQHKGLARVIEAAQVKAVEDCMAEGITDPNVIKERKQAARQRVMAEFNAPKPAA